MTLHETITAAQPIHGGPVLDEALQATPGLAAGTSPSSSAIGHQAGTTAEPSRRTVGAYLEWLRIEHDQLVQDLGLWDEHGTVPVLPGAGAAHSFLRANLQIGPAAGPKTRAAIVLAAIGLDPDASKVRWGHPDATLLALEEPIRTLKARHALNCAAEVALEGRVRAQLGPVPEAGAPATSVRGERRQALRAEIGCDAAEAAADASHAALMDEVDRLLAMRATTLDGLRCKARVLRVVGREDEAESILSDLAAMESAP